MQPAARGAAAAQRRAGTLARSRLRESLQTCLPRSRSSWPQAWGQWKGSLSRWLDRAWKVSRHLPSLDSSWSAVASPLVSNNIDDSFRHWIPEVLQRLPEAIPCSRGRRGEMEQGASGCLCYWGQTFVLAQADHRTMGLTSRHRACACACACACCKHRPEPLRQHTCSVSAVRSACCTGQWVGCVGRAGV